MTDDHSKSSATLDGHIVREWDLGTITWSLLVCYCPSELSAEEAADFSKTRMGLYVPSEPSHIETDFHRSVHHATFQDGHGLLPRMARMPTPSPAQCHPATPPGFSQKWIISEKPDWWETHFDQGEALKATSYQVIISKSFFVCFSICSLVLSRVYYQVQSSHFLRVSCQQIKHEDKSLFHSQDDVPACCWIYLLLTLLSSYMRMCTFAGIVFFQMLSDICPEAKDGSLWS